MRQSWMVPPPRSSFAPSSDVERHSHGSCASPVKAKSTMGALQPSAGVRCRDPSVGERAAQFAAAAPVAAVLEHDGKLRCGRSARLQAGPVARRGLRKGRLCAARGAGCDEGCADGQVAGNTARTHPAQHGYSFVVASDGEKRFPGAGVVHPLQRGDAPAPGVAAHGHWPCAADVQDLHGAV